MHFGVIFPHEAVPHSAAAVRDYARAVEGAGFDYLAAYDHVGGADTSHRPDWQGPYTSENAFHEVFTLFACLAGVTSLELATSVLVLPQRQTLLVAKQVAALDLLLGGRLRLGVGIGWNHVEFEALGEDFTTRGARLEEQVAVLRLLWQHESVTFEGRFHHLDRVGINPLPARVIPLWLGGGGRRFVAGPVFPDRVLDRIGRIADGWMAGGALSADELDERWSAIRAGALAVGRDPEALGLQLLVEVGATADLDGLLGRLAEWQALGVSHLTFHVARRTRDLAAHLRLLQEIAPLLEEARAR